MSEKIRNLLTGKTAPGVYHTLARAQVKTIQALAKQHSWHCFAIDGERVHDKATFLRAFAQALRFPAYFGQNWDAFEECLRDLTWLPPGAGNLVIYDEVAPFAVADPDQWKIALAILQDAAAHWQKTGQPLAVLLRKVGAAEVNVTRL